MLTENVIGKDINTQTLFQIEAVLHNTYQTKTCKYEHKKTDAIYHDNLNFFLYSNFLVFV